LPHLQQADRLEWIAREDRLLERLPRDQISIEGIENPHVHGPSAESSRCRRRGLRSGLRGWLWSRVQHDIDLAVRTAAQRELPLERDEPLALAAHAVDAFLQIRNHRGPCSTRDKISRRVAS